MVLSFASNESKQTAAASEFGIQVRDAVVSDVTSPSLLPLLSCSFSPAASAAADADAAAAATAAAAAAAIASM